ncbi:MAG: hypothetical protein WB762_28750 [Candidatus Sulfotelmatobacter sp.]
MPWLAKATRLSGAIGSAALTAHAAESALCAYLSLIALVGLGINAIWHAEWADPAAALVVPRLAVWGASGSHAREDLRLVLGSPLDSPNLTRPAEGF